MAFNTKSFLNWLWQKNPVTRVAYASAAWELKLIAFSLIGLFVSSLPLLFFRIFCADEVAPDGIYYCFSIGAVLAHVGFIIGLSVLVVKHYKTR